MTQSIDILTWVFVLAGTSCLVLSGFVLYAMIGEINRKLPDSEQVSYLFMYPGKLQRVKGEYRRFYPHGRLNSLRVTLNLLAILSFFGIVWRLGFFS